MSNRIKQIAAAAAIYVVAKWLLILTVGGLLYRSEWWSDWFFLAIPIVGLTLFNLVGKRFLAKSYRSGYRRSFYRILKEREPEAYGEILARTEHHYGEIAKETAFAKTSANPMDRRLDFSSYFLALIKSLEELRWDYESIRSICLAITEHYVRPRNPIHGVFKRLPVLMIDTRFGRALVRKLNERVSKKGHPDGFTATMLTDKKETLGLGYGIDITECGICKLFEKHESRTYVPILCEVDKITTTLAGLTMVRSGTIAQGAKVCDFRYRRAS